MKNKTRIFTNARVRYDYDFSHFNPMIKINRIDKSKYIYLTLMELEKMLERIKKDQNKYRLEGNKLK